MARLLQGDKAKGEISEWNELAHRLPAESELFPSRFFSTLTMPIAPKTQQKKNLTGFFFCFYSSKRFYKTTIHDKGLSG